MGNDYKTLKERAEKHMKNSPFKFVPEYHAGKFKAGWFRWCSKCGNMYKSYQVHPKGVTVERWKMDLCPNCIEEIEEYLRGK